MNRPPHAAASLPDPTIRMSEGWHCLHMYYQVDAAALAGLDADARARGRDELITALDPGADGAPERRAGQRPHCAADARSDRGPHRATEPLADQRSHGATNVPTD